MGVSPIWISGRVLPSLVTTAAVFASGASMAQAVSSPSTFGFAPVMTLFLPARSLPNQARMSLASASASAPVGLAARRAPSVCTDSLSAALAGSASVNDEKERKPQGSARAHGVSFVWFVA